MIVRARRRLTEARQDLPIKKPPIGIDRRSPVSWPIYEQHGPFPWSGTLHRVAITPGDPAPDSPSGMIDMLREMGAKFE